MNCLTECLFTKTIVLKFKFNCMNWFERWFLKRLCKKLVIQGPAHRRNIIEYYSIMQEAAKKEFYEDNKPTLDSFLEECHKESLGD